MNTDNEIGNHRLKIVDHFDWARNKLDIFTENCIQSAHEWEKEPKISKNIRSLNSDREQILSELSRVQKVNLDHLNKLNLNELKKLSDNEHQLGQKLFKIFTFPFVWRGRMRFVFIEDFYLNQNQISHYEALVGSQIQSKNEIILAEEENWWKSLLENVDFLSIEPELVS